MAACIRATSTLTPISPGPTYPRTARGGGAVSAAGDWLDFGSGVRDIFLHTWHQVRVPSLAVSPLLYLRPAPGGPICATVCAPYVCCALGPWCTGCSTSSSTS